MLSPSWTEGDNSLQAGIRDWARKYQAVPGAALIEICSDQESCRYQDSRRAVTLIQAAVRGRKQKQIFGTTRNQIIRIQAVFRGWQARKLLDRTKAACRLQQHVRGYLVRKLLREQQQAGARIQVSIGSRQMGKVTEDWVCITGLESEHSVSELSEETCFSSNEFEHSVSEVSEETRL